MGIVLVLLILTLNVNFLPRFQASAKCSELVKKTPQ